MRRDDEGWLIADRPEEKEQFIRMAEELEGEGLNPVFKPFDEIEFPLTEFPAAARVMLDKRLSYVYQYALFDHLEKNGGTRIINGFEPMLASNKATVYSLWERKLKDDRELDLRMPETLMTKDRAAAERFVEEHGDVLFKPIYASVGWGIERLDREGDYAEKIGEALDFFQYVYLQRFVPNRDFDVRTIVVGDEVVAQYARRNESYLHNIKRGGLGCNITEEGDLECPTEEGGVEVFRNQLRPGEAERIERAALKIRELSGLDMVGTDIMPGEEGELYLLEWNPSFQFSGAERTTGENVAGRIADYIRRETEKRGSNYGDIFKFLGAALKEDSI